MYNAVLSKFDLRVLNQSLVVEALINDFELHNILILVLSTVWLGYINDDSKGVFLIS